MSAVGERLRALLGRLQQQHRKQQSDAVVAARLAALRAWQARRLASTYADIHEVEPFAAACEFFLTDLYGEGDFADRDRAVERVVPIMMRLLPEGVLAEISRYVQQERGFGVEPGLSDILDEIELRAAVELAKLEMAQKQRPNA